MGGLARLLAQASDAIGPVPICFAAVTTERDRVDRHIGKPVLGIFAALDAAIPPAVVRQFGAILANRERRFSFKIYPNVGHSFMRPGNPDDAKIAWVAIEEFFSVYPQGEP